MTFDEATDNIGFNLTTLFMFVSGLTMALVNGTLLKMLPDLNIPQMELNDWIAIILSVLGGIFTIIKIANEVLKFIQKFRDIKEEKTLKTRMKNHINQLKDNESPNTRRKEESLEMGDPSS